MTTDTAAHEKAREIVDREPFADSFRGFPICRLAAIEVLTAEILAAEQRGREAAVPAWQPIETAPRDGTRFLSVAPLTGAVVVIHRHDVGGLYECWVDDCTTPFAYRQPSVWRPLPAAPQPKEPPRFSEVRFTQNGNATSKESDDVGKA